MALKESEEPRGAENTGFFWTGEGLSSDVDEFLHEGALAVRDRSGFKLTVEVEVAPPGGTTMSKAEATRIALRQLGLPEDVEVRRKAF